MTENGVHDSNAWGYEGPAKVRLAREGSFPRAWSGVGGQVESGWDVVRGDVCARLLCDCRVMETSDGASPKDKWPSSGCTIWHLGTGRQGQPDTDGAGHEGEGKTKMDDHGGGGTCWPTVPWWSSAGPAAGGR